MFKCIFIIKTTIFWFKFPWSLFVPTCPARCRSPLPQPMLEYSAGSHSWGQYLSQMDLVSSNLVKSHLLRNSFICQVVLKFCTEHSCIMAMLCAFFFRNDWITEIDILDKQIFSTFILKMSFRWITYIPGTGSVLSIILLSYLDWKMLKQTYDVLSVACMLCVYYS